MAVEEHRRIALREAAVRSWGEEVADTLVELVAPSGQELATRADVQGVLSAMDAMDQRWEARLGAVEARLDGLDLRLDAMDERWSERLAAMDERWSERLGAMDVRLDAMDERWSERLGAMDEGWSERLGAMDERWSERLGAMDVRLGAMEDRLTGAFERGLREAITAQTRALVVSLLVSVVAIAGLAFGLSG